MGISGTLAAHAKLAERYTTRRKNFVERLWNDYATNSWHRTSLQNLENTYGCSSKLINDIFKQLSDKGFIEVRRNLNGNNHERGTMFMLRGDTESAKSAVKTEFNEAKPIEVVVEPIIEPTIDTDTQREFNRHLQREFLRKIYTLVKPNEEFEASYKSIAKITEIPANVVSDVIVVLSKKSLFTRRYVYNSNGRCAYWTLLGSENEAMKALLDYQSEKKRVVTTTTKNNPPVRSSAISQGKGWVNMARQYMKGSDLISKHLAALKAAGIEVDESAYISSINIKQDATLAAIALVMPYIESLEEKCK